MKNNFSERIADVMHGAGMTVGALANDLRTSPSTVSRWLNGSVPRGRMLEDLAEVLGVSVRWLRDGEPPAAESIHASPAEAPRSHQQTISLSIMGEPDLLEGLNDCAKRLQHEKNAVITISLLSTTEQIISELKARAEATLKKRALRDKEN